MLASCAQRCCAWADVVLSAVVVHPLLYFFTYVNRHGLEESTYVTPALKRGVVGLFHCGTVVLQIVSVCISWVAHGNPHVLDHSSESPSPLCLIGVPLHILPTIVHVAPCLVHAFERGRAF